MITGGMAALLRAAGAVGLAEPEVRGLAALVGPGDVCLDIGAAYGMYSHTLAALVGPRGAVHAFEPLPVPSRILRAGARAGGGTVRPVAAAAGDVDRGAGELVLPLRFGLPVHGWAHLRDARVRRPGCGRSVVLRVPVRTVDAYCAEAGLPDVRFVKIDVEGAEPAVLAGAAGLLRRCRPALQLEIEQRHLDRYGHRAEDVVAHLRGYGYRMHVWRGGAWVRTGQVHAGTRNYLFTVDGSPVARAAA